MIGEADYRREQVRLAGEARESFLTPVEYFHPWYARAIGRYIVNSHVRSRADGGDPQPLRIVEVGGGNGTFAEDMLSWLRDTAPDVFGDCSYTLLEISEEMVGRQERRLAAAGLLGDQVRVVHGSAMEWPLPAPRRPGRCYVLGFEILDNLPHDLVQLRGDALWQCMVDSSSGRPETSWVPATDALVLDMAHRLRLEQRGGWAALASAYAGCHPGLAIARPFRRAFAAAALRLRRRPCMWLPSGALQLMQKVRRAEPDHELILADFDWLPPQPGGALHAPVVQSKADGLTADRGGDVLSARDGTCDILFPTNFDALVALYTAIGGHRARSVSNRDFMCRFAELEMTETRCGYNPLVEDFTNTRMLFARTRP